MDCLRAQTNPAGREGKGSGTWMHAHMLPRRLHPGTSLLPLRLLTSFSLDLNASTSPACEALSSSILSRSATPSCRASSPSRRLRDSCSSAACRRCVTSASCSSAHCRACLSMSSAPCMHACTPRLSTRLQPLAGAGACHAAALCYWLHACGWRPQLPLRYGTWRSPLACRSGTAWWPADP